MRSKPSNINPPSSAYPQLALTTSIFSMASKSFIPPSNVGSTADIKFIYCTPGDAHATADKKGPAPTGLQTSSLSPTYGSLISQISSINLQGSPTPKSSKSSSGPKRKLPSSGQKVGSSTTPSPSRTRASIHPAKRQKIPTPLMQLHSTSQRKNEPLFGCSSFPPGREDVFAYRAHSACRMRLHADEKSYICAHRGCDERYTNQGNYKRHMASHAFKAPFINYANPSPLPSIATIEDEAVVQDELLPTPPSSGGTQPHPAPTPQAASSDALLPCLWKAENGPAVCDARCADGEELMIHIQSHILHHASNCKRCGELVNRLEVDRHASVCDGGVPPYIRRKLRMHSNRGKPQFHEVMPVLAFAS
ncbi:hypothetical protein DFP72DRAFT_1171586 [Ephemerocybe angulata]|uniref:C2H2-type domain-containing protein n=1 Tax=Ephemerocybe angulata TaxID=980116 RepID=A0A8H6HSG5_9AGAR|nr:hypothetical protein DFP72DRAFT_1171586 [Tulosesus angulatus]